MKEKIIIIKERKGVQGEGYTEREERKLNLRA